MNYSEALEAANKKGFALRLVGENVSLVGLGAAPKKLLDSLRSAKMVIVEGLKSNPPEQLSADGFVCPNCRGGRFEIHSVGLVCGSCAKLAYLFNPDGGIVRVDCLTD